MKIKHYIIRGFRAIVAVAAILPAGCDNQSDMPEPSSTIRVNTSGVAGSSRTETSGRDDTFMVLFWQEHEPLESATGNAGFWLNPYLASCAPQPVGFYDYITYDTNRSYPLPETSMIYATGYAPGKILMRDEADGYKKLYSRIDNETDLGRYDFLSCDVWSGVYRGCHNDPFSQEKNRLYFRHLAAKLLFYADRDHETMENKQFVRNVQIKRLRMSIDGGTTWTAMYTPSEFEWQVLDAKDVTSSYAKVIAAVSALPGNEEAGTGPAAGYRVVGAGTFAGGDSRYVLKRETTGDRVPIGGMFIDSCYVCNPIRDGVVEVKQPIRLKMDISAEMSYDNSFPKPDGESTTDDLTFVREWKDMELSAIYEIDETGAATTNKVYEFEPGKEYRIYIRFNRSGVNLVARELPWDYGGLHYITIPSGDV